MKCLVRHQAAACLITVNERHFHVGRSEQGSFLRGPIIGGEQELPTDIVLCVAPTRSRGDMYSSLFRLLIVFLIINRSMQSEEIIGMNAGFCGMKPFAGSISPQEPPP